MLFLLTLQDISEEYVHVNQGITQSLTNTTDLQQFSVTVPMSNVQSQLAFRIEYGVELEYAICNKSGVDCRNEAASRVDYQTVLEPRTIPVTLEAGVYYVLIQCYDKADCVGNFSINTAVLLEDHTSISVQPQSAPNSQSKIYQFLLYVCSEKNYTVYPVSITANASVTYYLSRDTTNVGFPLPSNCTDDANTKCGVTDFTNLKLGGGLWMIYAQFENVKDRVQFKMDQTPFDSIGADGVVVYRAINNNSACSFYVQV